MRRLSTYPYLLLFLTAVGLYGQTSQPTPLLNIYKQGITATTVIDNRSTAVGQLTYVSIVCSGSSTWSVTLQYGSTSTGSFTTYDGSPTVTNSTTVPTAWGFLASYPNYIKVLVNSGSPTCNFSGFRSFYPSSSNGTITSVSAGTGIGVSGSIAITISNTGALSFNSRTGVISPTTGDYTAAQVTNAFDKSTTNSIGANPITSTDVSTPANPSAGTTKLYSKSGKICSLSPAGIEFCTGSSSSSIQSCAVAYAASLVIDTSLTSSGSQCGLFTTTLTGNVTTFSITNGSLTRGTFWQRISQDSTGGWTISGVAGDVIGMCSVDTGVSKDTWIQWEYNGTTFKEIYCTTNGTPTTLSVALGGTGATTFSAGLVRGNGTSALSGSELSGNAVTSGSNAVTVKGIQAGTSLPGTCTQGDLYFKTDASAGSNIYDCTSTNTWTQQSGGGGTQVVLQSVVNLDNASVLALGSTTLVAAPGANKVVRVLNVTFYLYYSTAAFATNGNFGLCYDTACNYSLCTGCDGATSFSTFLTQSANDVQTVSTITGPSAALRWAAANVANKAVFWTRYSGTGVTLGGGNVRIVTNYVIEDFN